jgi:YebC/PmpR family DNA-binding regulatory protein
MSGHSKWANIKHKKAKSDARKGKLFSKLIKEIIVAAKISGGDPAINARLRTAIEKARCENVPSENIERAIKRGTGELEGVNYEELFYEGYASGGVAVLVSVATDNRNRAASDVRRAFAKHNGRLSEGGSVAWMFKSRGLFTFDVDYISEDRLMDIAIEAGADDMVTNIEDKIYEVYTNPGDFHKVKELFDREKLKYNLAEISMIPKTSVHVDGSEARHVLRLMDELEDLDDVQNVFANFDISTDDIEKVA